MSDDPVLDALRDLADAELPPRRETAATREARERTIEAMVRATAKPIVRPRKWLVFSLIAAALLVAIAISWRAVRPSHSETLAVAPAGYVHGEAGEVVVMSASGATVAPPPKDRAWPLSAGDRVATLAEGRAAVQLGELASVRLSARTEIVAFPSGDVAAEVRAGTSQFDVSKLPPGHRFVVRAPDVEITVHGTSFRVSVDPSRPEGSRTEVVVLEGVVSVVSTSGEAATLTAAERWPAASAKGSADATSSPAPSASASSAASSTSSASSASPGVVDRGTLAAAPKSDLASQNALLEQAAAARGRGDGVAEAKALDAFVAKYPNSPGLHDALAARMRAADHAGDKASAAREAKRYLARFPNGPLRDEATQILARNRP